MEILAPKKEWGTWQQQLSELGALRPILPFDGQVIDFIDAVSRRVMTDPSSRTWPELVVVAHWMRKAHLREMEQDFRADHKMRLARGLVIHYAPSNVDSIFLYSWFISLLSGNSNVVRLSQRRGEQLDYLISRLNEVLKLPQFSEVRARNLLLSYAYDDAINAELCSRCAVRVIWGGDKAVAALRHIPIPPRATELVFPDRFSLAALRASSVCDCDQEQFHRLAKRFYNDAFSFDQLACSSPRLIVWTGSEEHIAEAKHKFWAEVSTHVARSEHQYPAIITMNRVTAAYAYAAAAQGASIASRRVTDFPLRVQLQVEATDFRDLHCGGGMFLEKNLTALPDLAESLTSKDQTLSYFGYDAAELKEFAIRLPGCAIDRIVPIGEALDFSSTWDGVDLFHSLTRCLQIH